VRLAAAHPAGHDIIAEAAQERMPLLRRPAQPGVKKAGRVGQQVERRSGLMQALDQRRHVGEGVLEHLVEAAVEGLDQSLLARMLRRQAAGRFARIAASIPYDLSFAWWHRWQAAVRVVR